jgi:hypothetical protein
LKLECLPVVVVAPPVSAVGFGIIGGRMTAEPGRDGGRVEPFREAGREPSKRMERMAVEQARGWKCLY